MRITTGHRDKDLEKSELEEREERRFDDKVRKKFEDRLCDHF